MRWVFDASVTLAWCFDDERTEATETLLDRFSTEPGIIPQIWPLEVANVLVLAVRKGRLSASKRAQFIAMLKTLPIQVDPATSDNAFTSIAELADVHHLTSYDAAYLELAVRLDLPLATLADRLRKAAKSAMVPLL